MSHTPPHPNTTTTSSTPARSVWRSTIPALALDVLPPLLIFYLLHALGISDVIAYTAGAVAPLGRLVVDRLRGQPFNAISGLIAGSFVASVLLALSTDDARAVVARGGAIFLALTLIALFSLPTRAPLMLALSRYFAVRARPDTAEQLDEFYRRPRVLRAMRQVTVVWALAFALSGAVCVVCAYTLPITVAAAVTALFEPVVSLLLSWATARYLSRTTTRLAATPPNPPHTADANTSLPTSTQGCV